MRRRGRDATNGKSQRVPVVANGRAEKGGCRRRLQGPEVGAARGLPVEQGGGAEPRRGPGFTSTSGDQPALGLHLREIPGGT